MPAVPRSPTPSGRCPRSLRQTAGSLRDGPGCPPALLGDPTAVADHVRVRDGAAVLDPELLPPAGHPVRAGDLREGVSPDRTVWVPRSDDREAAGSSRTGAGAPAAVVPAQVAPAGGPRADALRLQDALRHRDLLRRGPGRPAERARLRRDRARSKAELQRRSSRCRCYSVPLDSPGRRHSSRAPPLMPVPRACRRRWLRRRGRRLLADGPAADARVIERCFDMGDPPITACEASCRVRADRRPAACVVDDAGRLHPETHMRAPEKWVLRPVWVGRCRASGGRGSAVRRLASGQASPDARTTVEGRDRPGPVNGTTSGILSGVATPRRVLTSPCARPIAISGGRAEPPADRRAARPASPPATSETNRSLVSRSRHGPLGAGARCRPSRRGPSPTGSRVATATTPPPLSTTMLSRQAR